MKVIIVEDEYGAAQNLCDLLKIIDPNIEIICIIETVVEAVKWIEENPKPDIGFFDIRLADGLSFDIFAAVDVKFPIIFTTGYDEYTLQAFKVNSIDYLLKPVDKNELSRAFNKYNEFYNNNIDSGNEHLLNLLKQLKQSTVYRKNILVYVRDRIIPISFDDIAYIYLDNEITYCTSHNNEKYRIDKSLEKIWSELNPDDFFRVTRQFIVSRKSVVSAIVHFNRKLKLEIKPAFGNEILISKLKVVDFKKWLCGLPSSDL